MLLVMVFYYYFLWFGICPSSDLLFDLIDHTFLSASKEIGRCSKFQGTQRQFV
jgi:hypothetical protein